MTVRQAGRQVTWHPSLPALHCGSLIIALYGDFGPPSPCLPDMPDSTLQACASRQHQVNQLPPA